MAQYYGIERSSEYLEHYGVKGMRWGVRKAINARNTRALLRHYRKAQKKLAKLDARANSSKLIAKANKLDKVASGARKVGRVGLGVTAASSAISGVPIKAFGINGVRPIKNMLINKVMKNNSEWRDKINNGYDKAMDDDTEAWRREQHGIRNADYNDKMNKIEKIDSISRKAQIVGAGLAAGGYATSAAAKIRANILRKRATGKKHQAAVAEAKQFRSEMNKAFKGTKYDTKTSTSKSTRRHRHRR